MRMNQNHLNGVAFNPLISIFIRTTMLAFVYRLFVIIASLTTFASGEATDGATCDAPHTPQLLNSAFVFVKPQANTPATRSLVKEKLTKAGITILSETDIDGTEIDERQLIDQHYFSIASKATILPAKDIPVPADKFQESFGESWKQVLKEDRTCNALEACKRFECTASDLNDAWQQAKVVKFGGGFYCGQVSVNGKPEIYVFNAFFINMRSKFVGEGKSIHCYVVEWEPSKLSWAAFRNEILGPTDPSEAPKGSIRRTILDKYKSLGIDSKPNKGDNGVHASASPFEGLAEKTNWLGIKLEDDSFGRALLVSGLSKATLNAWSKDPQVKIADAENGSVFDALEDLNAEECLQKLVALGKLNSGKK